MTQSIEISSAINEDSEILANIMIYAWRSAFRGILPDTIIEQYTHTEACKAMFSQIVTSGQGTMYLAKMDLQPMGLLYWLPESEEAARIEALLTIPEAWGHGIGAALICKALADVRSLGYTSIHVWPFAENFRARRFYEKWGFAPTGESRTSDALELKYTRSLSYSEEL